MKHYIILLIGIALLGGCLNSTPVCNKPYITVGNECCLDQNDNGICDSDETTTTQELTTSIEPSTTSTITVTTSTTSIVIEPECYTNMDCGINGTKLLRNYACYMNGVYRQYITYRCLHPGTVNATCIGKEVSEIVKRCEDNEICIEGETLCKPKGQSGLTSYFIDKCDDMDEGFDRDKCYESGAEEAESYELCGRINETVMRDDCYWFVFEKTEEKAICGKIDDYDMAGECYYKVVVDENDYAICDKIFESYWREKCYDKLWTYP